MVVEMIMVVARIMLTTTIVLRMKYVNKTNMKYKKITKMITPKEPRGDNFEVFFLYSDIVCNKTFE